MGPLVAAGVGPLVAAGVGPLVAAGVKVGAAHVLAVLRPAPPCSITLDCLFDLFKTD